MWIKKNVCLVVVFLFALFSSSSCREAVLVRSLRRLREQIVRANLLVQEACFISDELERHTEYKVTLQIPADNLNANRKVCLIKKENPIHLYSHLSFL